MPPASGRERDRGRRLAEVVPGGVYGIDASDADQRPQRAPARPSGRSRRRARRSAGVISTSKSSKIRVDPRGVLALVRARAADRRRPARAGRSAKPAGARLEPLGVRDVVDVLGDPPEVALDEVVADQPQSGSRSLDRVAERRRARRPTRSKAPSTRVVDASAAQRPAAALVVTAIRSLPGGVGGGRRRRSRPGRRGVGVARLRAGGDVEPERGVGDAAAEAARRPRARASARRSGARLIRPRCGLSPKRPQLAAGIRIEPPPSEAEAAPTRPAATAAPEPPLEPPVVRDGSQGLRVSPQASVSVKPQIASSGRVVLPSSTAPGLAQLRGQCAASAVGGRSKPACRAWSARRRRRPRP